VGSIAYGLDSGADDCAVAGGGVVEPDGADACSASAEPVVCAVASEAFHASKVEDGASAVCVIGGYAGSDRDGRDISLACVSSAMTVEFVVG